MINLFLWAHRMRNCNRCSNERNFTKRKEIRLRVFCWVFVGRIEAIIRPLYGSFKYVRYFIEAANSERWGTSVAHVRPQNYEPRGHAAPTIHHLSGTASTFFRIRLMDRDLDGEWQVCNRATDSPNTVSFKLPRRVPLRQERTGGSFVEIVVAGLSLDNRRTLYLHRPTFNYLELAELSENFLLTLRW